MFKSIKLPGKRPSHFPELRSSLRVVTDRTPPLQNPTYNRFKKQLHTASNLEADDPNISLKTRAQLYLGNKVNPTERNLVI